MYVCMYVCIYTHRLKSNYTHLLDVPRNLEVATGLTELPMEVVETKMLGSWLKVGHRSVGLWKFITRLAPNPVD